MVHKKKEQIHKEQKEMYFGEEDQKQMYGLSDDKEEKQKEVSDDLKWPYTASDEKKVFKHELTGVSHYTEELQEEENEPEDEYDILFDDQCLGDKQKDVPDEKKTISINTEHEEFMLSADGEKLWAKWDDWHKMSNLEEWQPREQRQVFGLPEHKDWKKIGSDEYEHNELQLQLFEDEGRDYEELPDEKVYERLDILWGDTFPVKKRLPTGQNEKLQEDQNVMHELLINEGQLAKDSQETHIYREDIQRHVHQQIVQSSMSRQSVKEEDMSQPLEHTCPPCICP